MPNAFIWDLAPKGARGHIKSQTLVIFVSLIVCCLKVCKCTIQLLGLKKPSGGESLKKSFFCHRPFIYLLLYLYICFLIALEQYDAFSMICILVLQRISKASLPLAENNNLGKNLNFVKLLLFTLHPPPPTQFIAKRISQKF